MNGGYLTGRVGLTSTSLFSQAGVGWPLETVVGIQPFVDAERERNEGMSLMLCFIRWPAAVEEDDDCRVLCLGFRSET